MLTRPARIEIVPQQHCDKRNIELQRMLDKGSRHPPASAIRRIANNGGAERKLGTSQGQEISAIADGSDTHGAQSGDHHAVVAITRVEGKLDRGELGLCKEGSQHPPRRRRGRIRFIRNSIVAADPLGHGTPEPKETLGRAPCIAAAP